MAELLTARSSSSCEDSASDSGSDGPDLAALLADLDPAVALALKEHQAMMARHQSGATDVDVVPAAVTPPAAPPAGMPPAGADGSSTGAAPPARSQLEETMARLRLADSNALSARENAAQQRAPADRRSGTLPLTAPVDAARTLAQRGVVRLADVLPVETCAVVRADICSLLDAAVRDGRDMVPGRSEGFGNFGTGFGFGNARMREQRWDMYLPVDGEGNCRRSLNELLVGPRAKLGQLFREVLLGEGAGEGEGSAAEGSFGSKGDDASLFDWSCFTSDPGAPRQPVHPDNRYQPTPPLLTAFVALQDITEAMGATIFLPGTHTAEAHARFTAEGDGGAAKDALLADPPEGYENALLRRGDAAIFDPRCLHCGGANTSDQRRVLLYVSFRNPHCVSDVEVPPGSMLPGGERIRLREHFGGSSSSSTHSGKAGASGGM